MYLLMLCTYILSEPWPCVMELLITFKIIDNFLKLLIIFIIDNSGLRCYLHTYISTQHK